MDTLLEETVSLSTESYGAPTSPRWGRGKITTRKSTTRTRKRKRRKRTTPTSPRWGRWGRGQNKMCSVEFYHIQIYLHIICCRYINIKYVSIKSMLIFIYLYLVVLKCRLCILSVHILLNQLWFILPQTRVIVVGGWGSEREKTVLIRTANLSHFPPSPYHTRQD